MKNIKRFYASLLVVIMVFSFVFVGTSYLNNEISFAAQATKFTDVSDNHWAKNNIYKLVEKGFMGGFPDGTFRPDDKMTRAQMIVLLVKAAGLQVDTTAEKVDLPFYDGDAIPDWSKDSVGLAYERGITTGYNDGTFKPANEISRQEMVVMLLKALELSESDEPNLNFVDNGDIQSWALKYVARAVELGVIAGYSDDGGKTYSFKPTKSLTRAEAATMVLKAIGG